MPALTLEIENETEFRHAWTQATEFVTRGMQTGVERGVKEGAEEALRVRTWKDRTGDTRRAIRGFLERKPTDTVDGILECAVAHASFLDEGTEAHEIRPKEGRGFVGPLQPGQSRRKPGDVGTHRVALRWYDGGVVHFAKVVHHPGTKGDGFMAKAAQKVERVMIREIEVGVVNAQALFDD